MDVRPGRQRRGILAGSGDRGYRAGRCRRRRPRGPAGHRGAARAGLPGADNAGRRRGPAAVRPAPAVEEADDRRARRHVAARGLRRARGGFPARRDRDRPGAGHGFRRAAAHRPGRVPLRPPDPRHRCHAGDAARPWPAAGAAYPRRRARDPRRAAARDEAGRGRGGLGRRRAGHRGGLAGRRGHRAGRRGRPAVGGRAGPAAGVDLLLGQAVESVQPGGLALAGGGWLAADEVVAAVGVRPATGWLEGSDIRLQAGVAADEGMRSSVPGGFAAGACASFVSRRYGRRLRVEHWDGALHGPEVAAANVLGGSEIYDPVPYFWSEQFGKMLQYIGYHGAADRMIWRGDPAADRWGVCWLAGDQLVALLTVDRPRDLVQGRRVIAAGTPVDAARLADPEVAVKAAVAG